MKAVFIYALKDPRDGAVRYIGKAKNPEDRVCGHIKEARSGKRGHRLAWIRSLLAKELRPELELLAQVPESTWQQDEIDYIAAFRMLGCALVNDTLGGDGVVGRTLSLETRAKISAGLRGKKKTPEHCAALSKAKRGERHHFFGKSHTPSHKEKIGAARLGKKPSPETRAAISKALLGRKLTPEHCSALRLSHTGKTLPPAQREKISSSNRVRWQKRKANA